VTWRNLKIGKKLALGFGAVTIIAFLLGAAGMAGITRLSSDFEYVGQHKIPDMLAFSRLNYLEMLIRAESLEVLRAEGSFSAGVNLGYILDRRLRAMEEMEETWGKVEALEGLSEKGGKLLKILKGQYEVWTRYQANLDVTLKKLNEAESEEERGELFIDYSELMGDILTVSDGMGDHLGDLLKNIEQETALMVEDNLSTASFLKEVYGMFLAAGVLAAVLLTIGISKSITRPLAVGVELLAQIREGDLSAEAPEDLLVRMDEVGVVAGAVNDLSKDLRAQIAGIGEVTAKLTSAAAQISASVSQVAAGAEETSVAVVDTTATMEEVRTTAEITTKKSREVAEHSQQGLLLVQQGKSVTDALFETVGNIGDQMSSISETIIRLSEQSQEVSEIAETVEDLAEQSNLLAVNAAVEAAKAGEQGKGFSVVAREIKSLAEQSRQSAKEVQRILRDVQKAIAAAVMAIEQGSKAVERGSKEAGPSRESVSALTRRFSEAAQSAAQIAAANNELLTGVAQAARAMESIREAGRYNVTGMKEVESEAGLLRDLAGRLSALVERYRV
jgi:methyl-accepting chemotaxis protein